MPERFFQISCFQLDGKFLRFYFVPRTSNHTSGGYCVGVPPLPIPNREVKPDCADGTAIQCGRVGGRLFSTNPRKDLFPYGGFCVYIYQERHTKIPVSTSILIGICRINVLKVCTKKNYFLLSIIVLGIFTYFLSATILRVAPSSCFSVYVLSALKISVLVRSSLP